MDKVYFKLLKIDGVDTDKLYQELPPRIKEHVDKKKNQQHFKQSVVGWFYVYKMGLEYLGIKLENISFNENGKPIGEFYFNISHSKDLCLVCVSLINVGCDIEIERKNKVFESILDWTKYESFIKLKGSKIKEYKPSDLYSFKCFYYNGKYHNGVYTISTEQEVEMICIN